MRIDNSPARGNRDLLPAAVETRDRVLETIGRTYAQFGYQRIETPALENIERLTRGQGGENEKLIYQVLKRGLPPRIEADTAVEDLIDLGLRYDLTVPLSRFYGNNHDKLIMPFRSFQFGPVWRAERPQRGRYRQFYQCDIDIIGEASTLAEAELIEATTLALAGIGLGAVTVRLSDRRFLLALAQLVGVADEAAGAFFVILDKLDKIGWSGVHEQLVQHGFAAPVATRAVDVLTELDDAAPDKVLDLLAELLPALPPEVVRELGETMSSIGAGDSAVGWRFDPTLVRGMGYYTGQIFEISHPDMPGSIAGGGRYDTLIGRALNRDVPACGFSIGFERIVDLLTEAAGHERLALIFDGRTASRATVLGVARRLRAEGRTVAVIEQKGKLNAQLTRLQAGGCTSFMIVNGGTGDAVPEERPLADQP